MHPKYFTISDVFTSLTKKRRKKEKEFLIKSLPLGM